MNNQQYEILKPYETMFSTAINQQYISNVLKKDFDIVLSTYRQMTGDMYNHTISCGSCILSLYKKCGSIYFSYVPEVKEEVKISETKEVKKDINNKNK